MFCGCPAECGAAPNSRVCPVCLGLPGALPVVNHKAVELGVRTALALNCQVASQMRFDRKHYFYPDLPKNYQISQYSRPLGVGGYFEFPFQGRACRVRIRRVHLEEDAGKSVHDFPGFSGVDLNRAGTPLLEIVTEPDLRSAEQTREFAVQLQRLMRYLGVSEADMQKGQMRFEPNINLRILQAGGESRTPIVEVKNLNSFRALYLAVRYELQRQLDEWKSGAVGQPANKTNRGWDDVREITLPQREKEEVHDYRYFSDPDLPALAIDPDWVWQLAAEIPELPVRRAERLVREFGLTAQEATAVVDDRPSADLLDAAAAAGGDPPTLARQFLSFWVRYASERAVSVAELKIPAQRMAELANLVRDGRLSATAAGRVAETMLESADPPLEIAVRLSLLQVCDEYRIAAWVDQVLTQNPRAVRDALSNRKKQRAARNFLAGQVMKLSAGKAHPRLVIELIEKRLAQHAS